MQLWLHCQLTGHPPIQMGPETLRPSELLLTDSLTTLIPGSVTAETSYIIVSSSRLDIELEVGAAVTNNRGNAAVTATVSRIDTVTDDVVDMEDRTKIVVTFYNVKVQALTAS